MTQQQKHRTYHVNVFFLFSFNFIFNFIWINIFLLNIKGNGYYLVEDEKLNDKTTLYLCDQDEDNNYDVKCIAQPDSIRGYFRVTDSYESLSYQYIKCDGNKCEKLLTKNLNNKCNGAGDLIYDYNYVYLCFSDMNVRFSDFGNKIVNFGTKENIFTDEINVNLVINITTRHIIPTDLSERKYLLIL